MGARQGGNRRRRFYGLSAIGVTVCAAVVVATVVTSADARSRPSRASWRGRPTATAATKPTATAATKPTATSATTATATSATTATATSASATVRYTATDAVLADPERGFSRFARCDQDDLTVSMLDGYRTSGADTVVQCMFYLGAYRTRDLDAAVLDRFDRQLATVRDAGFKTVLRFAYTEDPKGDDAAPATVLRHIAQLKPHLRANADVVLAVQAGFVGAWGEWYYTQNFGNGGTVSASDRANRKAVTDALLDAVGNRQVQLRTPAFKRELYGTAALEAAEALAGTTAASRLGFHDDCFLADETDEGTYTDPAADKAYLAGQTRYTIMGGESCASNPPRTACTTATAELAQLHFTYLNRDYHPDVIAGWRSGGCLDTVRRGLGYRLSLEEGTYPTTATRSGGLPVKITLRNDGWAAPVNPRPVQLVLIGGTGGSATAHRIALDGVDPRTWAAGNSRTVNVTVPLPPDLPAGSYRLALALPDQDARLAARAAYAVRTANEGLWDDANGWNDLRHTVSVTG